MMKRYNSLDGLRGVAALLVVLFHQLTPNHFTLNPFVRNGYLSVDLFFLLSGFVICAAYSDRIKTSADAEKFLWLRFFRIYPLHFATLAFLVLYELLKLVGQNSGALSGGMYAAFTGQNAIPDLFFNLALFQGISFRGLLTWNLPSWSISDEFVAYILFCFVAHRKWLNRLWPTVILGTLCIAGYLFVDISHGNLDSTYEAGILRCMSGFFLGAILFKISSNSAILKWLSPYLSEILFIACLLVMGFVKGPMILAIVPIFIGLIATLQHDEGPIASALMSAPAQFLGRISYSLYMVHYPVLFLMSAFLKRVLHIPFIVDPVMNMPVPQTSMLTGDAIVCGTVLITIGLSYVTYRVIEAPLREWGRRNSGYAVGWYSSGKRVMSSRDFLTR